MKDPASPSHPEPFTLLRAAAVADGSGPCARPGSLLIQCHGRTPRQQVRVLDVGPSIEPPTGARVIDLPDDVLIPGLVNAHCHLDLTAVGPRPAPQAGGFSAWLEMLRRLRPQDSGAIADSVRQGIRLSLAGGVVAVGDIGGCPASGPTLVPWKALRASPLEGVSFLEFFSIGAGSGDRLARLEAVLADAGDDRAMLGIEPHAPYSVNLAGYEKTADLADRFGLRVCTHLAESEQEREFVERGTGEQRLLLERLGIWDDAELRSFGKGMHPVAHLRPVLERMPWLLAHVNDCPDEGIDILSRTGASVVYCPRAWRSFGFDRRLGPHRYRVMIDRGVRVCLGTDSIVNLPDGSDSPGHGRLSVLDEARELYRREGTDATLLLRMMTTEGAGALGLDSRRFRFSPGGPVSGVVAVRSGRADPLRGLFEGNEPPRLLFGPSIA